MKIEIQKASEETRRKFYDEFLYIRRKYQNIVKKPTQKVKGLTESVTKYFAFCLIFFLFTLSYTFQFRESIYYFLNFISLIYLLISIFSLTIVNKNIKISLKEQADSTIYINGQGIELVKKDNYTAKIEWPMIDKIVINHYSICIFPRQITSIMLAFEAKYKREFMEAIQKYQKETLVIDNSHLYK